MMSAGRTSNPDLFWALKGGLSNYAIVTGINIKTFPIANVWAGALIVPPPGYEATFTAMGKFLDQHAESQTATATLLSPAKGTVMASLFYDGPHEKSDEDPPEFAAFRDLPIVKKTFAPTNFVSIAKGSAAILPDGLR